MRSLLITLLLAVIPCSARDLKRTVCKVAAETVIIATGYPDAYTTRRNATSRMTVPIVETDPLVRPYWRSRAIYAIMPADGIVAIALVQAFHRHRIWRGTCWFVAAGNAAWHVQATLQNLRVYDRFHQEFRLTSMQQERIFPFESSSVRAESK